MSSLTVDTNIPSVERAPRRITPITLPWSLDKVAAWGLVVSVVFINGADFRGDIGEEFSVHWQILLRLGICLVCGFFGVLQMFPRSYRDFLTWPGLLVTAEILVYAASLVTSVAFTYSLAAWVSFTGVVLMIPSAMRLLGGHAYLSAILSGLMLYLVGSWIAYLVFPEIGVFKEYVTQTHYVERMGGLGHPNELGFMSAFTVIVLASLIVRKQISWSIGAIGIALAFATLLTCFSRTALLSCGVGLVVIFQSRLRQHGNVVFIAAGIAFALFVGFLALGSGKLDWMVQDLVAKITKSGTVEELATATGRTDIWAVGIERILESPIIGYGYCSTRFIMEEHSYHAHNIVLNATLFGGVLSGAIMLGMILAHISSALVAPSVLIDGLAACMIVGGMVEGLLGAPSPAATILIWTSILFWRQLDMDGTVEGDADGASDSLLPSSRKSP